MAKTRKRLVAESQEDQDVYAQVREEYHSLYLKGDLKGAWREARKARATYHGNVAVAIAAAAMLGDVSGEFPSPMKERMKRASVRRLRFLYRAVAPTHPRYHHAANEFFFHSGKYKRQFLLGMSNTTSPYLYSRGVGAAAMAFRLMKRGQCGRAAAWAKRAIQAWGDFHAGAAPRFDAFWFLALAHAVIGDFASVEADLGRIRDLAGESLPAAEYRSLVADIDFCRKRRRGRSEPSELGTA